MPLSSKFSVLWSASSTSYFGSWVMKLVLPLAATQLTNSPLLVAGVPFALTVPWILFSLPAGAIVDRADRRSVLLYANAMRVASVGLLVLAITSDMAGLLILYGVALVLGIAETLAETATGATIPMIVPKPKLEWANTRFVGAQMAVEVLALPLGGALATAGLGIAFGLGGVSFLVAFVLLLLLQGTFRTERIMRGSITADVAEGVRLLWRLPLLRTIAIMSAVINACWSGWLSVLVLYAVAPGPMGLSSFGYGLLLTGGAVGGVIGTLVAVPVQKRLGRRWSIGINVIGNALMFAAPALSADAWLVGLASVVGGLGGPMWAISVASLRQRIVPESLLGRVSAAHSFIGFGALAVGAPLAGAIAQASRLEVVFLITAVLTGLLLIPFFRVVSNRAMEESSLGRIP